MLFLITAVTERTIQPVIISQQLLSMARYAAWQMEKMAETDFIYMVVRLLSQMQPIKPVITGWMLNFPAVWGLI